MEDEGIDEVGGPTDYRSVMQELAECARSREKQQLAELKESEGAGDDGEDEDDERSNEEREGTAGAVDETEDADAIANGGEEEAEEEDDEGDTDGEEMDEEEGNGESVTGRQEEKDGEEDSEAGDIDDTSQPATLLQTLDADDDNTDVTTATLDSSPSHPEHISSDRFLCHFSHHRSLPPETLSQLTANTAQLISLLHVDGMRENLITLNFTLMPPVMSTADEPQPTTEQLIGVPALSKPVWLSELYVRPKIVERWQPITSKITSKLRKKAALRATAASSSTAALAAATSSAVFLNDDLQGHVPILEARLRALCLQPCRSVTVCDTDPPSVLGCSRALRG